MDPRSRLPFLDRAEIAHSKLAGYLLSRSHPIGQAKARFLFGLGFVAEAPEILREALLAHARAHPAASSEETRFGSKYVIDGPLSSPSGQWVPWRAIWFVESGERVVRFVTAYPLPGR